MYRHFFPDGPLFTRLLLRASGDGCVCAWQCRQQEKGLPARWLLIARLQLCCSPNRGHWVLSEFVAVLGAVCAEILCPVPRGGCLGGCPGSAFPQCHAGVRGCSNRSCWELCAEMAPLEKRKRCREWGRCQDVPLR